MSVKAGPGNVGPGSAPSYFVDTKKGEVNELKQLLRNQAVERDSVRKKEVVKKVIAYMTLGYDVSRLFGEMVMACGTGDIIIKKMCYLYLSNYAASNEELATLCINTMTKDCQDTDPMVRGLALRSLSSLKLESTLEYLLPILSKAFSDPAPYVRRNAVLATLKLHDLKPELVRGTETVDHLYNMIQDKDPQVSAACLMVLNEILIDEGGVAINRKLIFHLLYRLRTFNEWGQCLILHLVARYPPENTDEVFEIMNILDDLLKVTNSAVVIAAGKCFLFYAERVNKEIKEQIYLRLKQPMLTLLAGANRELRYSLLQHIHMMVSRCQGIFDSEFKQFYCDFNEPLHIKNVKLKILPELTNQHNVHELVAELSEYVEDNNQEFSRNAIAAFGRIAVKIPAGADGIINQLLEFLSMNTDYIRSEVACVIKDLLRKYPSRAVDVLPAIPRCIRRIQEKKGKSALIFMLGEYGAELYQAPYLLEKIVDDYDAETDVDVKVSLLSACAKLFFQRAPECHAMFAKLLRAALSDTSDNDLRDRALFYYKLLKTDIAAAQRIIASPAQSITLYAEEQEGSVKQQLFEEFNSLSVIYMKTAEKFIDEHHRERPNAASMDRLYDPTPQTFVESPQAQVPIETPLAPTTMDPSSMDLLNLGTSETVTAPPSSPTQRWGLVPNPSMEQSLFQSKWEALPQGTHMDLPLSRIPAAEELEAKAADLHIMCMASGDLGDQYKFYFFGKDNQEKLYFAEVLLNKKESHFAAVIKTENSDRADDFASTFMDCIAGYL